MRIKSVVVLPLLAVALGLVVLYVHNRRPPTYPDRGDRPLRQIPRESVRKFVINSPLYRDYAPDIFPELEGDKPGEMTAKATTEAKILRRELVFEQLPDKRLRQREPYDQRSDQELLQPLLDQILDMAIYDRVECKPEEMGFDQAHEVRVLIVTAERHYRVDFGTVSADGTLMYFKLEDSPYAYLTPVGRLMQLQLPDEKFLDHQLFSVPPSAIQRFVIETWVDGKPELQMDCSRFDAADDRGRPVRAWKLTDRPVHTVYQEHLRSLRLALMNLRATNRQWKLQYDKLPPELQFAIPWPNPLNRSQEIDRVLLTIEHVEGADHEEGRVEQYEMIKVTVTPELVAHYTGYRPDQIPESRRSFWLARHYAPAAVRMQEMQAAEAAGDTEPFEYEWISFSRNSVDAVLGLARRIQAGTEPAPPTAKQPGAPGQPGAE